ncbi:hypothetical protein [Rhodoferax koreensis]|uniref:hypothetical protein n=1 Tax=Rhodoferax koreensis TaxID=1842727 RepID=UPI0012FF624A|nr:hypothetical protein [Rhodoferax koreense]
MTDEEKRARGRPPLEEPLERRAMFLPKSVWAKIDSLGKKEGLKWAREVLAKAKLPKTP